jgi:lipid-binding SYLF domain-containing protein
MERSRPTQTPMTCMPIGPQGIACLLLALTLALSTGLSSAADDALDAKQLVEKAQLTLESFMADSEIQAIRELMRKAKGVYIAP